MRCAKEVDRKVVFVQYCFAPQYPHPAFFEDCCAALCWVYDHAEERNETVGTMHGFDIVMNVSMSRAAMSQRIAFIKQMI